MKTGSLFIIPIETASQIATKHRYIPEQIYDTYLGKVQKDLLSPSTVFEFLQKN